MKYKFLGKSGLRVSELCLGTMTFGSDWGWGASKEESQKIFNYFKENGGNFIDTANSYTSGSSESFIGEFAKEDRDNFVIATKFTQLTSEANLNSSGNHRKSMILSVEQSLKRLQTDYIDLLWIHCWDKVTPVEETLRALNDLISSGKIMYIGISDTPAWVISKAQMLAEVMKWNAFIGLQTEYSLVQRTPERELIPMANEFCLGITAWGPLGVGILSGKYEKKEKGRIQLAEQFYGSMLNDRNSHIVKMVIEIAEFSDCTPAQVALKWLQIKNVIPIIGAKSLSQLKENMAAFSIDLTQVDIDSLNDISQIDLGFPHDFLNTDPLKYLVYNGQFYNLNF
jgi:aryl-alcohol dehydrogenase-like predicted oxidoreductase